MNQLKQLQQVTKVVADTGELQAIRKFKPLDATTNPSLILQAAQKEEYRPLIEEAIQWGKGQNRRREDPLESIVTKLFVNFGVEILQIISGRVSTEVDAKLSFDVEKSIAKAKEYIALYEEAGIPRERVLIKLASTWEGVLAAKKLEAAGIHCNMTLIFHLCQAIACAEAGVTLISPFVGRISDWHKKRGESFSSPSEDPGVQSVTKIYYYYKHFRYKTQIMGASFRNTQQILELAGCDLLTISPELLQELSLSEGEVSVKLSPEKAHCIGNPIHLEEKDFRWLLNEEAMATEKVAEGIRNFAADMKKLETKVAELL